MSKRGCFRGCLKAFIIVFIVCILVPMLLLGSYFVYHTYDKTLLFETETPNGHRVTIYELGHPTILHELAHFNTHVLQFNIDDKPSLKISVWATDYDLKTYLSEDILCLENSNTAFHLQFRSLYYVKFSDSSIKYLYTSNLLFDADFKEVKYENRLNYLEVLDESITAIECDEWETQ